MASTGFADAYLTELTGSPFRRETGSSRMPQAQRGALEPPDGEITKTLALAAGGDGGAFNQLYELLYDRLCSGAAGKLRPHSVSPKTLVHKAFFRMSRQRANYRNRNHFIALFSLTMTRVLMDMWREPRRRYPHDGIDSSFPIRPKLIPEILAVKESLRRLRRIDRRAASVVKLKFYGSLSNSEAAEVLGVSLATVEADWRFARAWLHKELEESKDANQSGADSAGASSV